MPPSRPQRVSVQGISGSGKTTLGRELERRLGLRHVETDALVHGPGWSERPDGELRTQLEEVIARERWVIDSDYRRKVGTMVLEAADTVVWLDMPLQLCLRRLYHRTRRRIRGEERLWNDNQESWRTALVGWDSLVVFAIRKHFSQRRTLPELLSRPELAHLHVVRLRSPAEVRDWLDSITRDLAGEESSSR